MQTLNDIASSLGVSGQTLRNRIERYQEATGNDFYSTGQKDPRDSRRVLYPQDAIDGLMLFIDPNYQPEPDEPPIEPAPLVTVEVGNHATALGLPTLEGSFSLEQFRDSESVSYDDPDALVEMIAAGLDQIEAGMQADIAAREAKLKQSREAAAKLSKKAQQFAIKAEGYRIEAKALNTAQTQTTEQLQIALADVQRLGKSPG